MSKNLVLAVVLMALIFVSCGQSEKEAARIEAARQDSIAKVEAELQKIREDSIRQAEERRNRVTPDLAFFELKGPVKNVAYNDMYFLGSENQVLYFSEEGVVTTPKGLKFNRKNGMIKTISTYLPEFDIWTTDTYKSDSIGRKVFNSYSGLDGGGDEKFSYDESGNLVKRTATGEIEGEPYTSVTTYTYMSHDEYGNWTKRVVKHKDSYGTSSSTETRKITYYE